MITIVIVAALAFLVGNEARVLREEAKRHQRFTIEDLYSTKFPNVITGDLDLDVCKAGKYVHN